jgi:hypothetical protein
MRTEMPSRASQPIEHARPRRIFRGHVEHEVSKNHRTSCGMEEHDLVQHRRTPEQVLLDLALPIRMGFVAKSRGELSLSRWLQLQRRIVMAVAESLHRGEEFWSSRLARLLEFPSLTDEAPTFRP